MNTRKVEISPRRLVKLRKLFSELPLESATPHLDDEVIIGYVTETISAYEVDAVLQHLDSCQSCGTRLEGLLNSGISWQGPEGQRRILKMRRQFLETATNKLAGRLSLLKKLDSELHKLILSPPLFAPGFARAATPIEGEGETEDGLLQWFYRMDNQGNLTIRISSYDLRLEDVHVAVRSGDWEHIMTLEKVEENQVGATAELLNTVLDRVPLEKGIFFQVVE